MFQHIIIIGVILCICTVSTVMHFKMKYDEKENKKRFITKTDRTYYTLS